MRTLLLSRAGAPLLLVTSQVSYIISCLPVVNLLTRLFLASRVRRIILRGLPATWCTPAKVLSLVHGGNIESVHVHGNGTAHILFCEHEACQAFYDKYPNGIDLDKERRITVFVEMGKEVDVVSSQLSFNLSVGSTRAVRAVGVDMNASMAQLYNMACGSGRKVEKILDSYVPGDVSLLLPLSLLCLAYSFTRPVTSSSASAPSRMLCGSAGFSCVILSGNTATFSMRRTRRCSRVSL